MMKPKYLLNRFGFEKPYLLKDARVTLGEVVLDDPHSVSEDTTIYKALRYMEEKDQFYMGITNEQGVMTGMVTSSDFAQIALKDTSMGIDLLKQTKPSDICETLEGQMIVNVPYEDVHINGKVSIIALSKDNVDNYQVQDRIVIVGDDPKAQLKLIDKGAGMLIVVWSKEIDEKVIKKAKKENCPIVISGHGSMNTSRYLYFAPPVKLVMRTKIIAFHYWEYAEEVGKQMMNTRYRTYPVLDADEKLVGYVSRYHIMSLENKQIVMVDHNEFAQSVRAIDQARLVEVIDHHRIRDFSTSRPVAFRNEIVGSSATILTGMFQEKQIPIPQNLAGLLLGAILSDTLKFRSPTTTQKDIFMANVLGTNCWIKYR